MHEMQKSPHHHQFSTADGQRETTPEGMLPTVSRPGNEGVAEKERLHQAERSRADYGRVSAALPKLPTKWYRFIYRSPLMLIGVAPPLPDQYHEFEGDPGVFANWDVKGPFDTKEEAMNGDYSQ